jgi:hypothetical protein
MNRISGEEVWFWTRGGLLSDLGGVAVRGWVLASLSVR